MIVREWAAGSCADLRPTPLSICLSRSTRGALASRPEPVAEVVTTHGQTTCSSASGAKCLLITETGKDPASATGMDVGRELREARLRAGLSREQISQSTKIQLPKIEALEHNDFTQLP